MKDQGERALMAKVDRGVVPWWPFDRRLGDDDQVMLALRLSWLE